MKSNKDFRSKIHDSGPEDLLKKPAKLEPIKKSGKEKRSMYHEIDDEDIELIVSRKKESILDYYDEDEEEEALDEECEAEEEEYEEEEEYDETYDGENREAEGDLDEEFDDNFEKARI